MAKGQSPGGLRAPSSRQLGEPTRFSSACHKPAQPMWKRSWRSSYEACTRAPAARLRVRRSVAGSRYRKPPPTSGRNTSANRDSQLVAEGSLREGWRVSAMATTDYRARELTATDLPPYGIVLVRSAPSQHEMGIGDDTSSLEASLAVVCSSSRRSARPPRCGLNAGTFTRGSVSSSRLDGVNWWTDGAHPGSRRRRLGGAPGYDSSIQCSARCQFWIRAACATNTLDPAGRRGGAELHGCLAYSTTR